MLRTSIWLVALWIGIRSTAVGQETTSANHLRKGHRLAIMVCAFCHVAAPDQARMPILDPPAPSFESIAQRTDVTAEWLEKFISTTHRGSDYPSGMPNPPLLDYQVKQVTAYLLSPRK
jgi:cytochrome c1